MHDHDKGLVHDKGAVHNKYAGAMMTEVQGA